jgi:hypothetical protein
MDSFPWQELAQHCDSETALCIASLCRASSAALRDFFRFHCLHAAFSNHPRKREVVLSALLGRCVDCRRRCGDLNICVPYYQCWSCFYDNHNSVTEVVIVLGPNDHRVHGDGIPSARHRFGMPGHEFDQIRWANWHNCITLLKIDIYAHAMEYWGSLARMRAVQTLSPHARARLRSRDAYTGSWLVTREAFDRSEALRTRLAAESIKLDYRRQWPTIVTDYLHDRGPTLDEALWEFLRE